jgi:2-oxoglutarate dehydrogenase E2 component (dihydrolipoamide succinyltransferase)
MPLDIKVPAVGESITEGTLARWLRKEGDVVHEGDPLFELETDKATGEVPAPGSGRLRIKTKEGATVAVGAVVGAIEAADGAARAESKPERPAEKPSAAQPTPPTPAQPAQKTPAAASVPQTKAAPEHAPDSRVAPTREVEGGVAPHTPRTDSPASPNVTAPPSRPNAVGEPAERETRKPMSRIRRTIAERLVAAQHTAAILTTFNECDMSQILAIRTQSKESFKERHGVGLGFMSFFIKASIEALKAFPVVNSRINGNDIVAQHFFDIGVAVSTERGLMVPVIRDADRLSFAELEKAIETFAAKAREGKIAVEDLQGGTFTITNGGVFGSLLSTPILNPPQSAILGMHTIQKRPVAVNDQIAIRPMMYLALSYDHRLIDGREAVQFLVKVKECIENPLRLLWGF